ncbi:MAG: peptidoglycan bridge formation glycyltransferase FemA/FemB family protein [Candidatus Aenigmarchaeota archaeon]|nr:peptidoglycan bridge formation glycyltransferase FemA/FemB family protein [Candidatus Aenigmarchaeota archaeon]NIO84307.1 peptidoglycan bridge formation glycyltransferase FemA/FemB family protein [Candidatus Aminicenantes bacterium]
MNLSKSEKEIFSKFRKGTKSSIKKAVKEGVNVIVTSSLEGIKEFYKLNIITRKKHGMPPQPYIFFENIYKNIIEQDLGIIVLSTKAEKVIAGAVFFYFGDEAFYKYSASDPSSVHLSPNNVVMWEAIKWFNNRGFTSLCFGRSESSNLGLIRFKSGWGTEEAHLKYYRFDITKGLFIGDTEGHLHTYRGIFKKMPALILTAIGNFSYRHMG